MRVINGRNLYKNILNSKWMKTWIPEDPSAAAAKLALVSTITKDAVGCGFYTWQSLNNKKIPEDKRKFVAANDLSNGFYNVTIPLLLGNTITNASAKLFNWKIKDQFFDRGSAERLFNKLKKNGIDCTQKAVENTLVNKCSTVAKMGMATVFTLVLSQIFCKRVITPLLATPTADYIKKGLEKYDEKKAKKANQDGDSVEVSDAQSVDTKKFSKPSLYVVTSPTFDAFDQMVTRPQKFQK